MWFEMEEAQRTRELSKLLKEMNELLERILHAQFGIEDKKWLSAIETIEDGFARAVNFIGEAKGKTVPHTILTKEDIDKILED